MTSKYTGNDMIQYFVNFWTVYGKILKLICETGYFKRIRTICPTLNIKTFMLFELELIEIPPPL